MGIHAIGAPEMPPDDVFRQSLTLARFPNTVMKIHGMGEISDPPFPLPEHTTLRAHGLRRFRSGPHDLGLGLALG